MASTTVSILTNTLIIHLVCYGKKIECTQGTTIRVVDAVLAGIVGRSDCGVAPELNCSADATCWVSELSNKRQQSNDLIRKTSMYPECKAARHIIVKYMCGTWNYELGRFLIKRYSKISIIKTLFSIVTF